MKIQNSFKKTNEPQKVKCIQPLNAHQNPNEFGQKVKNSVKLYNQLAGLISNGIIFSVTIQNH